MGDRALELRNQLPRELRRFALTRGDAESLRKARRSLILADAENAREGPLVFLRGRDHYESVQSLREFMRRDRQPAIIGRQAKGCSHFKKVVRRHASGKIRDDDGKRVLVPYDRPGVVGLRMKRVSWV